MEFWFHVGFSWVSLFNCRHCQQHKQAVLLKLYFYRPHHVVSFSWAFLNNKTVSCQTEYQLTTLLLPIKTNLLKIAISSCFANYMHSFHSCPSVNRRTLLRHNKNQHRMVKLPVWQTLSIISQWPKGQKSH